MGCVAPDELAGFVAGTLGDDGYDAVLAHVDECSACRAALGEQAAAAASSSPMASTIAATGDTARGLPVGRANSAATPGHRIDRYIVMRTIGEGGMGVVTLARDPELRRKVVIKLVRPDILAGDDTKGIRTRLMVEAQAMARVSHPNVVPIYDVGTLRDQVFIAMEYIDGSNLAQWLEPVARKPSEILAVFRAAGRGLAAAHEAKLIHRDFKPHNVLIGKSGVVKVTDFGLARAFEVTGAAASTGLVATTDLVLDKLQLTRTGMLLGTPAYMSPEQITGDTVDHRSDQFSFCVALYHALYRVRPFAGTTMETLLDGIQKGQLAASKERVDPRIRAALVRGLAADPAARWPSMTELIAELSPRRRAMPYVLAGVGIAAIAGGFAVTKLARSADDPAPVAGPSTVCDAADPLAELWSPAQRNSMIDAARKVPDGENTGLAIIADLDTYVKSWVAMHRENCTATRIDHTQSEAIMLRRDACLEQSRAELSRAIDISLAATDRTHLDAAFDNAQRVRDLARCMEQGFQLPLVPHNLQLIVAVGNVRTGIANAEFHAASLELDKAEADLGAQLAEARKLKYPPVEADVQLAIGRLAMTRGKLDVATAAMTEAVQVADLGHADETKGRAQLELGSIMTMLDKPEEAERYRQAALGSLHDGGSLTKAQLDAAMSLAESLDHAGRPEQALAEHDKAVALAVKLYGETSKIFDPVWNRSKFLANVMYRYEESLAGYRRILAVWTSFAPTTKEEIEVRNGGISIAHSGMLSALRNLNRTDEAFELATKMIAANELVSSTRTSLALIYADRHDDKHALALIEEDISKSAQKKELVLVHSRDLMMRGIVLDRLGRFAEAVTQLREAIALSEANKMPTATMVVFKNVLAVTLEKLGRFDEAIQILARNITTLEHTPSASADDFRRTLARLAHAYAKAHQLDKAVATAQRGLAAKGIPNPSDVALLNLGLGLGSYPKNHARGLELVKQARAGFAAINERIRLAEIDAWLAKPD